MEQRRVTEDSRSSPWFTAVKKRPCPCDWRRRSADIAGVNVTDMNSDRSTLNARVRLNCL